MEKTVLAVIMLTLSITFSAQVSAEPANFFDRKAEGWFWYQRDPEPPKPPKPKKKEEPPPVVVVKPPEPQREPEPQEPAPLSAAWLEANLPKYLQAALDDPSQANITAYLYLQRLAVDMSQRFAEGAQAVVFTDPVLDESVRRPLATFGAKEMNADAHRHTDEILRRLSSKVGVWLFFRSDCPLSAQQAYVQNLLKRDHGIDTFAISLDGAGLPGGEFPDFVKDEGQSQQLQVLTTPALFLVNPEENHIISIGQGNLAFDEIKKRILIASTTAGWLSQEDFNLSRPVRGEILDPRDLRELGKDDIESPEQIINILRNRLSKAN